MTRTTERTEGEVMREWISTYVKSLIGKNRPASLMERMDQVVKEEAPKEEASKRTLLSGVHIPTTFKEGEK